MADVVPVSSNGQTRTAVLVSTAPDATGNVQGSVANPTYERSVGSAAFATAQVANSVSPAAAIQVAAARTGRRSVTFTNITGTQPAYFLTAARTDGVTTGFFLAATAGASVTIPTSAAVFSTSPTAAQTIGVLENY